MRSLEIFYSIRIFRLREKEINRLMKNAVLFAVLIFVYWFAKGTSTFGVLFFKSYVNKDEFTLEGIAAF